MDREWIVRHGVLRVYGVAPGDDIRLVGDRIPAAIDLRSTDEVFGEDDGSNGAREKALQARVLQRLAKSMGKMEHAQFFREDAYDADRELAAVDKDMAFKTARPPRVAKVNDI